MSLIGRGVVRRMLAVAAVLCSMAAYAQVDAGDAAGRAEDGGAFSFAVVGTTTATERATTTVLRAIGDDPSRFVVHFEMAAKGSGACADRAKEHRRALLDGSPKPVVPVIASVEWSDCPGAPNDPAERLERADDLYFGGDESLGQTRLPWLRQSALPRFKRYRENLRWQSGRILFVAINLPADNNGFRFGAGRNGEFEERIVANRAWLTRTFRLAQERKLPGIVLFVDGAPRFALPLRAPDNRVPERDGYYEFKIALRELMTAFHGEVLLVQGQWAGTGSRPTEVDHPLRAANGKPFDNLIRIPVPDDADDPSWLRVAVDPDGVPGRNATGRALFRIVRQRMFDDPSGELYGAPPGK